jgi:NAD-dependent dihydropyrimidine dehydrogenase PreA subunit
MTVPKSFLDCNRKPVCKSIVQVRPMDELDLIMRSSYDILTLDTLQVMSYRLKR